MRLIILDSKRSFVFTKIMRSFVFEVVLDEDTMFEELLTVR